MALNNSRSANLKSAALAAFGLSLSSSAIASAYAVQIQSNALLAKAWIERLNSESKRFEKQKPEVPRKTNGALEDARSSLARMVCWSVKQKLSPADSLSERIKIELETLQKSGYWPTETPLAMAEWTASYSLGLTSLATTDQKKDCLPLAQFLRNRLIPELLTIWSKNGAWESYDSNQRVALASAYILAERTLGLYELSPKQRMPKVDDGGIANYIGNKGLVVEGYAYWRYASSLLGLTIFTPNGMIPNTSSLAVQYIAPSGLCANFGDSAEGEEFFDLTTGQKSKQAILTTSIINNKINWATPNEIQTRFINQMVNATGPWEEDRRFFALAGLCTLDQNPSNDVPSFAKGSGWGNGEIAIWRTNAISPNSFIQIPNSYLAIRGMKAGLPHAQMDAGSFIFETDKTRWICDPGKDDYDFPGYFSSQQDGQRWKNRFCSPQGHSTFWVEATKFKPEAVPQILINSITNKVSFGSVFGLDQEDMSRTFEFTKDSLILKDHFQPTASKLGWNLITDCEILQTNQMVKLIKGSKSLGIKTNIGTFTIEPFDSKEAGIVKRPDLKRIVLTMPPFTTDVRVVLSKLN